MIIFGVRNLEVSVGWTPQDRSTSFDFHMTVVCGKLWYLSRNVDVVNMLWHKVVPDLALAEMWDGDFGENIIDLVQVYKLTVLVTGFKEWNDL